MVIWTGITVGALLGLVHAAYVYRVFVYGGPAGVEPNRTQGIYFATWTLVLWILFGSYVLTLWLAGAVLYLLFKALR